MAVYSCLNLLSILTPLSRFIALVFRLALAWMLSTERIERRCVDFRQRYLCSYGLLPRCFTTNQIINLFPFIESLKQTTLPLNSGPPIFIINFCLSFVFCLFTLSLVTFWCWASFLSSCMFRFYFYFHICLIFFIVVATVWFWHIVICIIIKNIS